MAFRSPGARPSPRIPKQQIPDGPVQEFATVIQTSIAEDWQKRTSALTSLVAMIPVSHEGRNNSRKSVTQNEWYASPPTLRHLAPPMSELIKDARSTVVKRTCESLNELFSKCRSDARYLFKDLMPSVCQVHASTVQVIRNYVQIMVLETLHNVPCKMAMPVWLDRLKHDKSRTVREACSLYLSSSMALWGGAADDDFENDNNGYLSRDIYLQVGTVLIKTLRDPSPIVRQNCKKGLETLAGQENDILKELVDDRSLTRDVRVMKLLRRLQAGEHGLGDEVSVSSKMSRGGGSIASAPAMRSSSASVSSQRRNTRRGVPPKSRRGGAPQIPATIGVESPAGGLGPPRHTVHKTPSPSPSRRPRVGRRASGTPASPVTPRRVPGSPGDIHLSTPTKRLLSASYPSTPVTPLEYEVERKSSTDDGEEEIPLNLNKSFDSTDTDVSVLRPIANADELRKKAKTRTLKREPSRRSSLLLDRLLRSASKLPLADDNNGSSALIDASLTSFNNSVATMDVAHLSASEISSHPHLPIHTKIAYELLEAHKTHVDQVMETLKVEMDALKDFEMIMLEQGPLRPSEEEVLEYFESLGLCLEQRKKAGSILQKKMDRISQG